MAAPSARASILIDNIGMLASPAGDGAPLRGPELGAVDVTRDAAVAIVDGRIEAAGPRDAVLAAHGGLEVVDGGGRPWHPGHGAGAAPGMDGRSGDDHRRGQVRVRARP